MNERNPKSKILLGPGPSNTDPRVLRALSEPTIGHLDPDFVEIMDETTELLRYVFQTKNELTIPISGTGSAGMETAMVNSLEHGDKAIICVAGIFGERMVDVAERAGAVVVRVDAPWGRIVDPQDVKKAVEELSLIHISYELGCKGVTVYRDGSREEQVLTVGAASGPSAPCSEQDRSEKEGRKKASVNGIWGKIRPIERPSTLEGFTTAKETPLGKLFLTLNTLDGHPVELFAQIGKAGSDVAAFTEAIARMVSIALRSGIDPQEIADQLMGIGGSRSIGFGPNRVRSVPDAIGQFIDEYINHLRKQEKEVPEVRPCLLYTSRCV